jgi:hypothetical protein
MVTNGRFILVCTKYSDLAAATGFIQVDLNEFRVARDISISG